MDVGAWWATVHGSHKEWDKTEVTNICTFTFSQLNIALSFPGGSEDKASACNAGDPGSIPGLGRFSGEGNDNPLQYSCLENSMDRGAWWATVHGVAKSRTRLIYFTYFKPRKGNS